ncbi:MAG: RidA family protein [Betaproteobacteria bacterium]|nr:RidA family protein [Betaproteobacteria bacterium]
MEKRFFNPEGLARPGVYTPVVAVSGGRTIYISGQVSQNADGELVGRGDLAVQAEQVYRNLELALQGAGAGFGDVVKINVYVVGYRAEYRSLLNAVRSRYVSKDNPPVSTLIGVQVLARDGFLIEIEAVAVTA